MVGLAAIFFVATFLMPIAGAAEQKQEKNSPNIMAENILDMEVHTTNGKDVGEIEDVVFNKNGKIKEFIIDIGGFLGIGEKRVAISTKELKYDPDKEYAVYQGTRSDLENKPEIDYYPQRYYRGYYPPNAEPYGYGYGYNPYYRGYYNPYYYGPYWPREYPPRGYYDRGYEGRYGGMATNRNRDMDQEGRTRARNDRERKQMGSRSHYAHHRGNRNLSMDTLIDADVRSQSGEIIGEIEDLVVSRRGRITHAIIDVGGFLGIGEKQVAVPFDRLQNIGPYFVMYPGTEEQLESMPGFDKSKMMEEAGGNTENGEKMNNEQNKKAS